MRLAAFQEHDGRLHEAPMGPEWFMYLDAGMPSLRRPLFCGAREINNAWHRATNALNSRSPEHQMYAFMHPAEERRPPLDGDEMALARFMVLDSGYAWARRWLGDLCSP